MKIYLNQFQTILKQLLYQNGVKTIDNLVFNEISFLVDLNLNINEFQRIVVSWLKSRFMVRALSKKLRDQLLYMLHRSNVENDNNLNLVMIKIIKQRQNLTSYKYQSGQYQIPSVAKKKVTNQKNQKNKKSNKTLKNNKKPKKNNQNKSLNKPIQINSLANNNLVSKRVSLNDVKKSADFNRLLKQTLQNRIQIKELENMSLSKSFKQSSLSKNLNESFPSDSDDDLFVYESSSVKQRQRKKLLRKQSSLSQLIQSSVEMLSIIDEVSSKRKKLKGLKDSSKLTLEIDYNQFQIQ